MVAWNFQGKTEFEIPGADDDKNNRQEFYYKLHVHKENQKNQQLDIGVFKNLYGLQHSHVHVIVGKFFMAIERTGIGRDYLFFKYILVIPPRPPHAARHSSNNAKGRTKAICNSNPMLLLFFNSKMMFFL